MVTDLGGQLSWLLAECCGGSGSVCRHRSGGGKLDIETRCAQEVAQTRREA